MLSSLCAHSCTIQGSGTVSAQCLGCDLLGLSLTLCMCLLQEEDVMHLLGAGMPVLADMLPSQQLLELMKLREMVDNAHREAAAADAAVAAVAKVRLAHHQHCAESLIWIAFTVYAMLLGATACCKLLVLVAAATGGV